MSSPNVIPILSSSPPPLSEVTSQDDDEFGDFEEAAEYSFDSNDDGITNRDKTLVQSSFNICDRIGEANLDSSQKNRLSVKQSIKTNCSDSNGCCQKPVNSERDFVNSSTVRDDGIGCSDNNSSSRDIQSDVTYDINVSDKQGNYSSKKELDYNCVNEIGNENNHSEDKLNSYSDCNYSQHSELCDKSSFEGGDENICPLSHTNSVKDKLHNNRTNQNKSSEIPFDDAFSKTSTDEQDFSCNDYGDFSGCNDKNGLQDSKDELNNANACCNILPDSSCGTTCEANNDLFNDADRTASVIPEEGKNIDDAKTNNCEFTNFDFANNLDNNEDDLFDSDGDDFGDFKTTESIICNTGECFADFSAKDKFTEKSSENIDDDWTAEFQSDESTRKEATVIHSKLNPTELLLTVFTVPFVSEHLMCQDDSIVEDNVAETDDFGLQSRVWTKLKQIDESPSLCLQWSTLKSSNLLLKSLKIDTRNILLGQNRNSSVPLFASNLGLLEPTKSNTSLQKFESSRDGSPDGSTSPQEVNISNENIPPVQFDWSVSGLTNPLESLTTTTSALLDFEIFDSSSPTSLPASNSKSSSLEDEFLSSPSPEPSLKSSSSVLDKLMSNVKLTTVSENKRPSGISNEADDILNKLIPLSFMQAKVLMFPINSERDT